MQIQINISIFYASLSQPFNILAPTPRSGPIQGVTIHLLTSNKL